MCFFVLCWFLSGCCVDRAYPTYLIYWLCPKKTWGQAPRNHISGGLAPLSSCPKKTWGPSPPEPNFSKITHFVFIGFVVFLFLLRIDVFFCSLLMRIKKWAIFFFRWPAAPLSRGEFARFWVQDTQKKKLLVSNLSFSISNHQEICGWLIIGSIRSCWEYHVFQRDDKSNHFFNRHW